MLHRVLGDAMVSAAATEASIAYHFVTVYVTPRRLLDAGHSLANVVRTLRITGLMALPVDHSIPFPSPRGVYRATAAKGMCALVAVDSHGEQFMRLEMPADAYDPSLASLLWDKLNAADPVVSIHLERNNWGD